MKGTHMPLTIDVYGFDTAHRDPHDEVLEFIHEELAPLWAAGGPAGYDSETLFEPVWMGEHYHHEHIRIRADREKSPLDVFVPRRVYCAQGWFTRQDGAQFRVDDPTIPWAD